MTIQRSLLALALVAGLPTLGASQADPRAPAEAPNAPAGEPDARTSDEPDERTEVALEEGDEVALEEGDELALEEGDELALEEGDELDGDEMDRLGPAVQPQDPESGDDGRIQDEELGQGPALGEPEVPDIVPDGEAELMDDHPVDSARIEFVPGKGLRVTSADGRFRLVTRARVQIAWQGRGNEVGGWGQEVRLRRARLQLEGFMFSEDVRFNMELAVSPSDMGITDNLDSTGRLATQSPLLDFYVDFRQLRDLQVRVGQYKIPSNRTRVISSGDLQLVDRSILSAEFTLDRDVGFDLRSGDFLGLDLFRYYAGIYIARGRGARGVDDFGMMYLARVEYLPFGMFADYSEVDFQRTGPRLSIGAGYAHIDRAQRTRGAARGDAPADGGTTDTHQIFADFIFKWRGLSAIGELAWRDGRRIPGDAVDAMGVPIPTEPPRAGIGATLQAGYLIPHLPLEVAGRYGLIRGLGDATETSLGDTNELTAGLSYYPGRHPYKVQLDYSRLWDDSLDDGDHRIRLQIQVAL